MRMIKARQQMSGFKYMAEGMGFEPMWTCAQTVFKCVSL